MAGAWLASVVVAIIASCVCVPAKDVVVPITDGLELVVVVSAVVSSRLTVAITMVALLLSGMFVVVSGIEVWLVWNVDFYSIFWCWSTVAHGCWCWSLIDSAFLWLVSVVLVVVTVSGVLVDVLSRRTICVVILVPWGVVVLGRVAMVATTVVLAVVVAWGAMMAIVVVVIIMMV